MPALRLPVVAAPGRGRPPAAAARRASLEDVEKTVTTWDWTRAWAGAEPLP